MKLGISINTKSKPNSRSKVPSDDDRDAAGAKDRGVGGWTDQGVVRLRIEMLSIQIVFSPLSFLYFHFFGGGHLYNRDIPNIRNIHIILFFG